MSESDSKAQQGESTVRLIERVREGDTSARDILVERYFARLHGWARGRLPRHARFRSNTEDLVQETLIKALSRLEAFEPRGTGSFLAYLRTILKSRVIDEIRAAGRRPAAEPLEDVGQVEQDGPSPVDELIGAENMARYEKALAMLRAKDQEVVIMRIELQFTYRQIAEAMGMTTANAARMAVKRGIVRLTDQMRELE